MEADYGDGNGVCFPYDVLMAILRRLPTRALAGSRLVCRAWRAIVDAHDLLLPHYFPTHAFPGIFINKIGCHSYSAFFGPRNRRSATAAAADDGSAFLRPVFRHSWSIVRHSCNGLLLLQNHRDYYVCNPATVRCSAPLPNPSLPPTRRAGSMFLAFDPAVSLHYEVFFFQEEVPPPVPEPPWVDLEQPYLPRLFGEEQLSEDEQYDSIDDMVSQSEEQPQEEGANVPKQKSVPFTVYSSRTGRWENREFAAGRCVPGHLYDMVVTSRSGYGQRVWSSEYWRESLYMHFHKSVLVILRPSNGTYDMVKLPGEPCHAKPFCSLPTKSVLASYERGIHYVAINQLQLQVWMLTESIGAQLGWTLSHEVNLTPHCHMVEPLAIQPRVTWGVVESSEDELVSLFEDGNYGERICSEEYCEDDMTDDETYDGEEEDEAEELGSRCSSVDSWNSDEDNFIDVVEGVTPLGLPAWGGRCQIIGFHPHKHAIILLLMREVVAYHLNTSRLQYLGEEYELIKDSMQPARSASGSFPYRPCYVDALPARKLSLPS
jgi:hypothetical protein